MRVSIARALSVATEMLLLDEPFGPLDQMTRDKLNADLLALRQTDPFTGFFVTHSVAEAVFLSTRIVVLAANPGRIATVIDLPFSYPRFPGAAGNAGRPAIARRHGAGAARGARGGVRCDEIRPTHGLFAAGGLRRRADRPLVCREGRVRHPDVRTAVARGDPAGGLGGAQAATVGRDGDCAGRGARVLPGRERGFPARHGAGVLAADQGLVLSVHPHPADDAGDDPCSGLRPLARPGTAEHRGDHVHDRVLSRGREHDDGLHLGRSEPPGAVSHVQGDADAGGALPADSWRDAVLPHRDEDRRHARADRRHRRRFPRRQRGEWRRRHRLPDDLVFLAAQDPGAVRDRPRGLRDGFSVRRRRQLAPLAAPAFVARLDGQKE